MYISLPKIPQKNADVKMKKIENSGALINPKLISNNQINPWLHKPLNNPQKGPRKKGYLS